MVNTEKGSVFEPLLIILGLALLLVFFVLPQAGITAPSYSHSIPSLTGTSQSVTLSSGTKSSGITNSAYASSISIGQGNAAYSIDPIDEYITIANSGSAPVSITGWTLENNTGNRTYYAGNNLVHYASTEVTIPKATGYISPAGANLLQNIILKPGETAIVTTGAMGVVSPYQITSFKENECSGYIEALPQYDFSPSLSYMCIPPSQEPGLDSLDSACRTFVSSLSSCQTPTFGKVNRYSADNCDNCVNGYPAPSSACFNFIKMHFSYQGCIDYHANDPKFYGNTWRIFLGQKWEMWGKDTEAISLFDQFGKLAAYKAY